MSQKENRVRVLASETQEDGSTVFSCVKSIKFNKIVCRLQIFTYIIGAGKYYITAGSDGKCSRKTCRGDSRIARIIEGIIGPIIHCSPALTRTTTKKVCI